MDNWYYTLSAIAQTCGAILALGGAFIVFKLDKVQQAISNYEERLKSIMQVYEQKSDFNYFIIPTKDVKIFFDKNKNEDLIKDAGVQSKLVNVYHCTGGLNQYKDWLITHKYCFNINTDSKKEILILFILLVILLTLSILINIFFLGFAEYLKDSYFTYIVGFSLYSILVSSIIFIRIITIKYIN